MKTIIEEANETLRKWKENNGLQDRSSSEGGADLTAERLRGLLEYDGTTGVFHWKGTGERAGSIQDKGYRTIEIGGRSYYAHRLAWLYTYGSWPNDELDHIDRNKDNNSISNLRDVSRSENNRNRRSWAKKNAEDK